MTKRPKETWLRDPDRRPLVRPPGKKPKRLPPDMACDLCGGPMLSLPGYWLGRGEYAAKCEAGCSACMCGKTHPKGIVCFEYESVNREFAAEIEPLETWPVGSAEPSDDIPF